jgi:hypothetical protein
MPNAYLGWVPGALFGTGTMTMQVLLGSLFGGWMARRRFTPAAKAFIARAMSGRTLLGGGLGFLAAAVLGIADPELLDRWVVVTPIQVHNLHTLGVGFFLAVPLLFGIATWAFFTSVRDAARVFGSIRTNDGAKPSEMAGHRPSHSPS